MTTTEACKTKLHATNETDISTRDGGKEKDKRKRRHFIQELLQILKETLNSFQFSIIV